MKMLSAIYENELTDAGLSTLVLRCYKYFWLPVFNIVICYLFGFLLSETRGTTLKNEY